MEKGTILYLCSVLLPLYCTFFLTSFPIPPLPNVQYIQTVCDCGGVLKCTVDNILQEFYTLFLTRFRTYKIASPSLTKMTSKDDIKGLVSLKFLRPWPSSSPPLSLVTAAPREKVTNRQGQGMGYSNMNVKSICCCTDAGCST
jgi:hypothetical protein